MIPSTSSSGRPWMDGKPPFVVEHPIPSLSSWDDRPLVSDLIQKHQDQIDSIRAELKGSLDDCKHDNLWLLRFCLSHGRNKKAAVQAIRTTLQFRQEHRLDETDVRFQPFDENHPVGACRTYTACTQDGAFSFVLPDVQRGVVGFLRMARMDQAALVENLSEADWLVCFIAVSEWTFQWLDYVTRTTGRLTKSIRFADMEGVRLRDINKECQKRDGRAMAVMEDCYPQMLQSIFILRSPAWIQVPWRIVRPLFPKRVVSKIDFIAPESNKKELERLLKYISLKNLPDRYGGQNPVWPVNFPLPNLQ